MELDRSRKEPGPLLGKVISGDTQIAIRVGADAAEVAREDIVVNFYRYAAGLPLKRNAVTVLGDGITGDGDREACLCTNAAESVARQCVVGNSVAAAFLQHDAGQTAFFDPVSAHSNKNRAVIDEHAVALGVHDRVVLQIDFLALAGDPDTVTAGGKQGVTLHLRVRSGLQDDAGRPHPRQAICRHGTV